MQFVIFAIAVALAIVANPAAIVSGQEVRPYSNIFVRLNDTVDPIISRVGSRTFPSRGAKLRAIRDACRVSTGSWQAPVLEALKEYNVQVRSYWVTNMIHVRNATPEVIKRLREFPTVKEIKEEEVIPKGPIGIPRGATPNGTEWGVTRIGADKVWPYTRGEGIVVGVIDTGVRGTHGSLADNFREEKGWLDPYYRSPVPTDNNGHGTHSTGIICGMNGIGVAPGAQWIACRGCDTDGCTASALLECGQFMLCPTDPDGSNEDCSYAPHIISNSWGSAQGLAWYEDVINAWNAAGIMVFFPVGNNGPSCNPPSSSRGVIYIGSTNMSDNVSSFSGRGPPVVPNGEVVPFVVAPGEEINSAYNLDDGSYEILTGISMASQHAAGGAALLLSHDPNMDREQLLNSIASTAYRDLGPLGSSCGANVDGYPNNVAGYGRLDVWSAYNALAMNGSAGLVLEVKIELSL